MKHAFICECGYRSCTRKLYLLPSEYEKLASVGQVISTEHNLNKRAKVTGRSPMGEAVAVVTPQPKGIQVWTT